MLFDSRIVGFKQDSLYHIWLHFASSDMNKESDLNPTPSHQIITIFQYNSTFSLVFNQISHSIYRRTFIFIYQTYENYYKKFNSWTSINHYGSNGFLAFTFWSSSPPCTSTSWKTAAIWDAAWTSATSNTAWLAT